MPVTKILNMTKKENMVPLTKSRLLASYLTLLPAVIGLYLLLATPTTALLQVHCNIVYSISLIPTYK